MYCKHCGSSIDDKSAFCRFCGKPLDTAKMNKTVADEEPRPTPPQPVYTPPAQNAYAPPQYYAPQPQYCAPPPPAPPAQKQNDNTIAIVGFILSFFVSIAGLVCSIIGYRNARNGAPNKGLAIAGIVVSSVTVTVSIISSFSYLFWLMHLWAIVI